MPGGEQLAAQLGLFAAEDGSSAVDAQLARCHLEACACAALGGETAGWAEERLAARERSMCSRQQISCVQLLESGACVSRTSPGSLSAWTLMQPAADQPCDPFSSGKHPISSVLAGMCCASLPCQKG